MAKKEEGVVIAQICFIAFIAAMAFISGILPGKIPWCKNSINVLGIANAFSGGVFLAIAFMHILPEVSHDYGEYMEDHEHDHDDMPGWESWLRDGLRHGDEQPFPLPFLLVFLGYAFILLIDKVVFDTHSLAGEHHGDHVHDVVQESLMDKAKSSFIKFHKMVSGEYQKYDDCINENDMNEGIRQYLNRNDKFALRMSVALGKSSLKKMKSRTFAEKDHGLDEEQADLFQDKDNIDLKDSLVKNNGKELEEFSDTPPSKCCTCNLTPVVLMIALSTHAIFEGIAVGVVDNMSDLWTYIMAISLHKWAAAMSLGISMSKNFKDEQATVYVLLLIFAFATPLGIAIGMVVSGTSDIIDIIFSSLAGGTFVYIACSEVIVEEFSVPVYKLIKFFCFLLGAGLITGLNFLE